MIDLRGSVALVPILDAATFGVLASTLYSTYENIILAEAKPNNANEIQIFSIFQIKKEKKIPALHALAGIDSSPLKEIM